MGKKGSLGFGQVHMINCVCVRDWKPTNPSRFGLSLSLSLSHGTHSLFRSVTPYVFMVVVVSTLCLSLPPSTHVNMSSCHAFSPFPLSLSLSPRRANSPPTKLSPLHKRCCSSLHKLQGAVSIRHIQLYPFA